MAWWQRPALRRKIAERELAATCPGAVGARGHHVGIVVQHLEAEALVLPMVEPADHDQVELALEQPSSHRLRMADLDVKRHAGMAPREPVDDGGHEARRERRGAADPHLALGRIREEFDILHALPQLVERRSAA